MMWLALALLGLGLVGLVFVVGYALALRRRFGDVTREALRLRTTAEELRATVARSER